MPLVPSFGSFSRLAAGFQHAPGPEAQACRRFSIQLQYGRAVRKIAPSPMKPLLYAALAAYVVAAIHSILAFVNKRRAIERLSLIALACGFAAHTAATVLDWVEDGHYPLMHLHETISFLAW